MVANSFWWNVVLLSGDDFKFAEYGVAVLYLENLPDFFRNGYSSASGYFGVEGDIIACYFCRQSITDPMGMGLD